MSSDPQEGHENSGVQEPWHVPHVDEDALGQDLPPEIAAAARRASQARRPGVTVAQLVAEEAEHATRGPRRFRFAEGDIAIDLRLGGAGSGNRLQISSPRTPGAAVEVLHGGETVRLTLDHDGNAQVESVHGLLSVVISPFQGDGLALQTTWVRVG